MKEDLLVDTDVLVDFLRGKPQAIDYLKMNSDRIALSVIVTAELYSGAWTDRECEEVDDLIRLFPVLPVNPEIAREGGQFKAKFGKSHGLGLADALLAATAAHYGLSLETLNTKHFPMFPDLKPAYSKSA